MNYKFAFATLIVLLAIWNFLYPISSWAHCDSLNGPVIQDARVALEKEDPTPVLKWVREEDEKEIKEAFEQTLKVRKTSPQAKELVDRYFFETLVRIHRAGEGEGFTGLKPADNIDPGILAADRALEKGTARELSNEVSTAIRNEINRRFEHALALKKTASSSTRAGRKFVEAYVDYIHFVETAHNLVRRGVDHKHQ